jgi:hypothetical protein
MAKKAKAYKAGGAELVVKRNILKSGSKIQSVVVTAKDTMESLQNSGNEAVELQYDDLKKYVETNRKALFGGAKRVQINVFTERGWRSGYRFDPNGNIDWFSVTRSDGYNESVEIETVYAVQILLF